MGNTPTNSSTSSSAASLGGQFVILMFVIQIFLYRILHIQHLLLLLDIYLNHYQILLLIQHHHQHQYYYQNHFHMVHHINYQILIIVHYIMDVLLVWLHQQIILKKNINHPYKEIFILAR